MACSNNLVADVNTCLTWNENTAQYWCTHDCHSAIAAQQYGANLVWDSNNAKNIQNLVGSFLFNYVSQYPLGLNQPFSDQVVKLCLDPTLPGICSDFQSSYCNTEFGNQNNFDAVQSSVCGCYTNNPTLDPCTGLCLLPTTSKLADGSNLNLCPEQVCIINDVQVNAVANQTQGNVNIVNICPGCNVNGNCTCVVQGADVNSLLGTVGMSSNIAQFCGPQSTFLQLNSDGSTTPIDPNTIRPSLGSNPANPPSWSVLGYVVVSIAIILLVLTIAWAILYAI